MPDIIKGTKKKTPISGGGAYVDYGGNGGGRTVTQTPSRVPSRSNASSDRGTGVNIYEKNGVMTRAAGKVPALSQDMLGGSGGYQIGGLQGNRSVGGSAGGTGTSGTGASSAVQEEVKRRVAAASQGGGSGTGGGGNGSAAGTYEPSAGGSYSGGSYYGGGGGSESMSYDEYYKTMGGDSFESDVRTAVAARVKQSEDEYNRQKEQAKTNYDDAARQAYVNSMMSQRNLDQQMAAGGVYGGMADSQRIALDASYQNEVSDLERQYIETLADLDQAIEAARLAGETEIAEQMAARKSTVAGQYAAYLLQKDQEAAQVAQWQREQAASGGSGGSYSYGGGYDNGSLTPAQVAEMQRFYNVDADGVWGPQSSAATYGLTAEEAWEAYQRVQGGGQSGYGYNYSGVNRQSRM